MLSKEDYNGYLNEIFLVEKRMHDVYADCAAQVDDIELKALLIKLAKEEEGHCHLLEKVRSMVMGKQDDRP
jgi:rubrerythrin